MKPLNRRIADFSERFDQRHSAVMVECRRFYEKTEYRREKSDEKVRNKVVCGNKCKSFIE